MQASVCRPKFCYSNNKWGTKIVTVTAKSVLLKLLSGGAGLPRSQLEQYTAILQRSVAGSSFDAMTTNVNENLFTRISVVMPSYNQVEFIERSILSVLNQNYPNLQFVIMDGGSKDGTVNIIRKYERDLVWRSEPDNGQSDAINKALAVADGELVGWLNSDDVYFPGALSLINKAAWRHPRAVLYSGMVAMIDRSDRVIRVPRLSRPTIGGLLFEGFPMHSQGVFWRRAVQSQVGLYDIDLHYAMDFDFWLKLLTQGDAEFLPAILGGFRIYEGTKTSSAPERGHAEVRAIRKRYGVDDTTVCWRMRRNLLFVWKALRRSFATKLDGAMLAKHR
jgi:glycosyltransferase involved in cell wall biosynthesis